MWEMIAGAALGGLTSIYGNYEANKEKNKLIEKQNKRLNQNIASIKSESNMMIGGNKSSLSNILSSQLRQQNNPNMLGVLSQQYGANQQAAQDTMKQSQALTTQLESQKQDTGSNNAGWLNALIGGATQGANVGASITGMIGSQQAATDASSLNKANVDYLGQLTKNLQAPQQSYSQQMNATSENILPSFKLEQTNFSNSLSNAGINNGVMAKGFNSSNEFNDWKKKKSPFNNINNNLKFGISNFSGVNK